MLKGHLWGLGAIGVQALFLAGMALISHLEPIETDTVFPRREAPPVEALERNITDNTVDTESDAANVVKTIDASSPAAADVAEAFRRLTGSED